jgi:hypothetical protein
MNAPEVPAMEAYGSVSESLAGMVVVAVVPAAAELDTAAMMAWHLARSAANSGRRVALVDCYVDEPRLHAIAGQPNDAGIVDVFEYGASLSRIARPQPEPSLSFVSAGTYAPDRIATMAHPAWRRLAAEFRRDNALMLLFVAPECLGTIAVELDGIVALAPGEAEAGLATAPGIASAVDAGVPLVATLTGTEGSKAPQVAAAPVPDAPAPASPPAVTEVPAEPVLPPAKAAYAAILRRRAEQQRKLRKRLAMFGAVAVLVVAAVAVIPRRQGTPREVAVPTRPVEPPPAPAPVVPAVSQPAPHAVDSLPFAVEVLTATSSAAALALADRLERSGVPTLLSPLRLAGRTSYRVYAGPVGTRRSADSLVRVVRRAGLDRARRAKAALVPLSFALLRVADSATARVERTRLRQAGILAFVLGQADGTYELFSGAFSAEAQSRHLDDMLTAARSAGVLGPRVGALP